jgi:hypothetical protein
MNGEGISNPHECVALHIVISLRQNFPLILKDGNRWSFSLGNFVSLADVRSVQSVLLVLESHLNKCLRHCAFL